MTTTKEFQTLAHEVLQMEAILASLTMLTIGRDVAEEIGQPLDMVRRKVLIRETLAWAADTIARIDMATRVADAAGEN